MAEKPAKISELFKHLFIWIILFFVFFPLYLMLNISLKDNHQFITNPWYPQAPFRFENWSAALEIVGPHIANTIVVASGVVILSIVTAICGAYFFARYKMPGSRILYALFMLLMLYPGIANLVPLFNLLSRLRLLNTLWALILVGSAGGQVLVIYVLRNFIEDLPEDLFNAAEIDGAGPLQQIKNIVIPLSGPIISVMVILRIIAVWNNFVLPLVVIRDNVRQPLAVGLLRLEGEYTRHWGELMAGYSLASIPLILLFIFTMKFFVKGLSSAALKG